MQCSQIDDELEMMSTIPYVMAIGCLMCATKCTRPDLAYIVSVVSKFMANPRKEHW